MFYIPTPQKLCSLIRKLAVFDNPVFDNPGTHFDFKPEMCQEPKKLAELEVRNFCVVISTRVIAIKQEVISFYGI